MPPKRKGFYANSGPESGLDLVRERNVEALIQPLMQAKRTVPRDLPVERIRPNPFQARRTFDVAELVQAIRAQGFTSRLRVRADPADAGYFQLVFGERRLRAAQEAGLTTVPCEVAEHSDEDMIEIGLAENIQRQDLDPLEEAEAFRIFVNQGNYTVRSLAERLGKDKGYVENRLALLRTPADVQEMMKQRPDTMRAAREIAKLPTVAAREPLIEGLVAGTLNVQDVNTIVKEAVSKPKQAEAIVAERVGNQLHVAKNIKADVVPAELDRKLARSAQTLQALISEWHSLVPFLTDAQRKQLLQHVEQHLIALEQLTKDLQ